MNSQYLDATEKRLKALMQDAPDAPREEPKPKELVQLEVGAFPDRHIRTIPTMNGPAADKAKDIHYRVFAKRRGAILIVAGDRGRGKTQMATYWGSFFPKPRYFKALDLVKALRGEFSPVKATAIKAETTLRRAKRAGYLVLDEWQERQGSEYERTNLVNIIDTRYDAELPTVILTNAKHDPEVLQEDVGASIYSRCKETGGTVNCDWESYR